VSNKNKIPKEGAKSPSQRMEKTRLGRKKSGLVRRDVWGHIDDWPAIRGLEAELVAKRGIKI
jgi:hypothetical protein